MEVIAGSKQIFFLMPSHWSKSTNRKLFCKLGFRDGPRVDRSLRFRKMFRKKIRDGKTLQSGKRVGTGIGGLRNPKKVQDLRSSLARKKAIKAQTNRDQITGKSNVLDVRQKIAVKKRPIEPNVRSISLLDEHRKEQRKMKQLENRSLTVSTGGNIQVTTRREVPTDRRATMMGDSIQITAKVERRKEDMDRQAKVIAGQLTITAKNEDAKRKQREHQARRKEKEARKKEQVREMAKRRAERERSLYTQNSEESKMFGSSYSQGYGDESLGEGRLDNRMQGNTVQAVTNKEERSSSTRITVSNLHPAVTQQDVQELFGVIGSLKSCKMLGGGCAIVVYANEQDALTAVRRYHNRKLDGQPMQCKLNTQPTASLYSQPPQPARLAPLAPLAPLRPAAHSTPRPLLANVTANGNRMPTTHSTVAPGPVVFKVRI